MDYLTEEVFRAWMSDYKKAWESRNPDLAVNLFSRDAEYYLSPFAEPYKGKESIRDYWEDVPIFQTNNRFDFETLFVRENTGFAHCRGTFEVVVSGEETEMDGIFEVELDGNGKCKKLRQWWHQKGIDIMEDKPHP